jgi:hypothetical protein
MRVRLLLVLSVVVLIPGAALSNPQPSMPVPDAQAAATPASALEQGLLEAQHSLIAAMARHDVQYLKSTLADDFIAIDPSGNTYGKGDLLEYSGGAEEEKGPKPILYDFKVVTLNDSAGVVAYNIVLPHGRPRYLHLSHTWVKQDGQWKLKFEQATPNLWSAEDLD